MSSNRYKRFNLSEITPARLVGALAMRLRGIPQTITWHTDPIAQINREKIEKYRNIHQGRRCFIVANGPSLQHTNLDLLQGEFTFGLNRIYLLFEQTLFRPTYYVAVNDLVLDQFSTEISQLGMPKFLNWSQHDAFASSGLSTIFLKNKNSIRDAFQVDLTKPVVFGATVTFVALQLAYYMGFQEVIIVGLDHNFSEKGTPNKIETRKSEQDESHFHEQYFPKGIKWQLPDLIRSEMDYAIARQAFELDGRKILDATLDGKCQVFSKIDYLSLFK